MVMGILFSLQAFSQARLITGKVTDQKGNPVPRASITVKGSTTGVSADDNGSFSINIPGNKTVLIISAVGFQYQEITAGNNTQLNITLSDAAAMSEVVVTALGITSS